MASNDLLAVILVTNPSELNAARARVLASKGQGDINVVVDVEKEGKHTPLISEDHHFSAPALQTFDNGPMQYKFSYVLRVPTAGKTYCNLGGAVHEVIENLTRQELEGIPPTEEQALALTYNDLLDCVEAQGAINKNGWYLVNAKIARAVEKHPDVVDALFADA